MLNIFFKANKDYSSQLNPIHSYIEQLSSYISIKKQLPITRAKEIATDILKKNFNDKSIKYFQRKDNGDREVVEGTLYGYINDNIKEQNVMVPTLTSYIPYKTDKSILSEFIFVNVKKRSIAKKAGQRAKAQGDLELAISKNNEQNMMKIYNNSLSGVFGQEACILYNPTAHNTLTSITRTITSLSNASNEKLIGGNSYLPRPVDALNYIVYISTYTLEEKVKEAINFYSLRIPTVEEVVKVLRYSTDLYFEDKRYYNEIIIPYLNNLTPYQLANICYTGDLYHIREYNPTFIRNVITELTTPVESRLEKLEDVSVMYKLDESVLNFTHSILYSKLKGKGKDYSEMNKDNTTACILETYNNVVSTLNKYKLFFNTFFMTNLIPINSNRLTNMRRRSVVLSDTDSTCFTLDEWVTWYKGQYNVDDKSIAVAAAVTYIASQAIVNSLATLSRNMNVDEEFLSTLAMKSEYTWSSIVTANVSKHYYAQTIIQEGNVFSKPELELKGVHYKNSAVPKLIIDDSKEIINYILDSVNSNKSIRLNDIIKRMVDLETNIKNSVMKGETIYLKKSKIKSKEAYALDEFKSPYQRHQLWLDVFMPKYGSIDDTPYDVVKIPTIVTSRPALAKWLESIEDLDLKLRLKTWLIKYAKNDLPTIYLNEVYIQGNGIPLEIVSIIDLKRIVFDMTMQHRLVLETLGVMLNNELTISEQFNVY